MTTTTKANETNHNAREGMEAVMARRSFYVVEYVSSHTYSRTFATKRAAAKWAKHFARVETTRVLEGGFGGIEVARFEKAN